MHHYPFHPSDYLSHTRHLSLMEDLAYRRMLDLYYMHERPLGDRTDVQRAVNAARLIGMPEHEKEVESVLDEFFPDGRNHRADREIAKFASLRAAASRAGKASGNARSTTVQRRLMNARSTVVQPTKNEEPRTRNEEPVQKQSTALAVARPDSVSEQVWSDWKKGRKPTVTGLATLQKQAVAAGMTLQEAMEHMLAMNHKGFFPPKTGANGKDHRPRAAMANLPRADDAAAIKAFYPQPKEGEFM